MSPPVQVVNSQTMIMTKRKIQEASSSHGNHHSSEKGSKSQIRIGIQASERKLNGTQQIQGDLPHGNENYHEAQNSRQGTEDASVVKDLDSSQGNIVMLSAQPDLKVLQSEKQSLEITMKNSLGGSRGKGLSKGKKGHRAGNPGLFNLSRIEKEQVDQDDGCS